MKALIASATALLLAGIACGTPLPSEPKGGEQAYRKHCLACHALERGLNTPAGPNLHEVVTRPIAAEPDFNYSPALRVLAERERRWTAALLDRFLADPDAVAPGTEMGFVGVADPAERRALIRWLARRARPG